MHMWIKNQNTMLEAFIYHAKLRWQPNHVSLRNQKYIGPKGIWNVLLGLISIWLPKSMFYSEEKIHNFSLLSVGARNQIWIHFQGDADVHTRGSMGIGG